MSTTATPYRSIEDGEPRDVELTLHAIPPRARVVILLSLLALVAYLFFVGNRRVDIDCTRPSPSAPWSITVVERRIHVAVTTRRFEVRDPKRIHVDVHTNGSTIASIETASGRTELARFSGAELGKVHPALQRDLELQLLEPEASSAHAHIESEMPLFFFPCLIFAVTAVTMLRPYRGTRLRFDRVSRMLYVSRPRWLARAQASLEVNEIDDIVVNRVENGRATEHQLTLRTRAGVETVLTWSPTWAGHLRKQAAHLRQLLALDEREGATP